MFERLIERAAWVARQRVEAQRLELAERLAAELPKGVRVEAVEEGVRLSGPGLVRRFALEPRLRWLLAGPAR